MISGYFKDLFLALREMVRVCKDCARVAIVIGNVQYYGVQIPVDELTAELGELAGLKCDSIAVARYRGNSAQQMGRFGRRPARESVVSFTRPNRGELPRELSRLRGEERRHENTKLRAGQVCG
jgi:hypothetical protein